MTDIGDTVEVRLTMVRDPDGLTFDQWTTATVVDIADDDSGGVVVMFDNLRKAMVPNAAWRRPIRSTIH